MFQKTPQIMGILNITPDSFSDGGCFDKQLTCELQMRHLIESGTEIIDIGGESTGPGSKDVSAQEELKRVSWAIDMAAEKGFLNQAMFSVDTYKSKVAEYALQKGFQMVNDVTALRGDPKMIDVLLKYKPYIILMYAKDNTPRTTTDSVEYDDVMKTVIEFLESRIRLLLSRGFPKGRIVLDPGMGAFLSANPKYSFEIIERLGELKKLGYPILIGVSRKSFLGGRVNERDEATVEWSLKAIENGADIVRVHRVELMKGGLNLF